MGDFWAQVRRAYTNLPAEIRQDWREAREDWRDMLAEIRQQRQFTRRMWQRATGKPAPSRRDKRRTQKAILAEGAELDEIARRVIAEHGQQEKEDGHGTP